jgi:hypothetical protein
MGCINSKASSNASFNAAGEGGNRSAKTNAKEDLIELQLNGKRDKRVNVIAVASLDDPIDIPSIPKSDEYKQIIRECVQSPDAFFFTGIREAEVSTIVEAMAVVEVNAGQTVISKGDVGDRFYIVASGEYKASIDGKSVKKYGPKQVRALLHYGNVCFRIMPPSYPHFSLLLTSLLPGNPQKQNPRLTCITHKHPAVLW